MTRTPTFFFSAGVRKKSFVFWNKNMKSLRTSMLRENHSQKVTPCSSSFTCHSFNKRWRNFCFHTDGEMSRVRLAERLSLFQEGLFVMQLVTVNFWVLNLLLDPALIEDTQVLQDYVPSWMNHSLHTSVLLFTLAELLLSHRSYPRWSTLGRMRSTVVVLAYTSWYVLTVGNKSTIPPRQPYVRVEWLAFSFPWFLSILFLFI